MRRRYIAHRPFDGNLESVVVASCLDEERLEHGASGTAHD
jgi:hypothetical protein